MERRREPSRESRRGFLKKLALLGASITVLATPEDVITKGERKSDEETLAETTGKRYRLTAHISRYYETARG